LASTFFACGSSAGKTGRGMADVLSFGAGAGAAKLCGAQRSAATRAAAGRLRRFMGIVLSVGA
ncbi:MAG: hypothetical protein HXO80_06640, partial [Selenomonas sp.]|nr:hypothetical protein [Selenomonas sp.]